MSIDAKQVRDRVAHYLNPETATAVGLTLEQLKQVITGTVALSDRQIKILARRMGVTQ
jgi:hypothetical protein